jgi:hypothetical protein
MKLSFRKFWWIVSKKIQLFQTILKYELMCQQKVLRYSAILQFPTAPLLGSNGSLHYPTYVFSEFPALHLFATCRWDTTRDGTWPSGGRSKKLIIINFFTLPYYSTVRHYLTGCPKLDYFFPQWPSPYIVFLLLNLSHLVQPSHTSPEKGPWFNG